METLATPPADLVQHRKSLRRQLAISVVFGGSIFYGLGVYVLIGNLGPTDITVHAKDLSRLPLASRLQSGDPRLTQAEIHAAALQLETHFEHEREMLRRRSTYAGRMNKPYQGWYQRVSFLERELAGVKDPPEGTLEWHMQRELERMQEDKPPH